MDKITADVVHISQETLEEILKLSAEREFYQDALSQGFGIQLVFGQDILVWHGHKSVGQSTTASGPTLAAALHSYIKKNRMLELDPKFRAQIIRRFQAECPHDGGITPTNHGYASICDLCGGQTNGMPLASPVGTRKG
jgi:hypothetical protein